MKTNCLANLKKFFEKISQKHLVDSEKVPNFASQSGNKR